MISFLAGGIELVGILVGYIKFQFAHSLKTITGFVRE